MRILLAKKAAAVCFLMVFAIVTACADKEPVAFEKCKKCHGPLGGGGTRTAPDLAITMMTQQEFKTQVLKGSGLKGREKKNSRYRWKNMPAQRGLSDDDIGLLYRYVRPSQGGI